jgi:cytoskeletal protein CcmA (bactofilin family)
MLTSHTSRGLQLLALLGLLCLATSSFAQRTTSSDQTHFGHTIRVAENDQVAEVTCIGCSIYIRGQVAGDATAVGGSIYVEGQGQVSGDVTTVGGSIRLDSTVKVAGDVTSVAGEVRRATGAQVSGDVTSIGGGVWLPLVLLTPFVFLGLLVWLIVWLVQRARRPAVPAAT